MSSRKDSADIRRGDVIMFGDRPHLVTEIEPYTHPTHALVFVR